MNKLTALIEAAKADCIAREGNYGELCGYGNDILELCALLEKAEMALDGCLARLYGELYPNHPETLEVEEALTTIKQWKEQT